MSGLWCEHFEEYANDSELLDGVFAENGGFSLATATPPRPGATYLFYQSTLSVRLRRIFGETKTGAGFGYRCFIGALPSGDGTALGGAGCQLGTFLSQSGAYQMLCFLGSDGSVIFASGVFGANTFVVVDRSEPCITARTYQTIEFKCVVDSVSGSFECRVNGNTVLSYTGDTDPQLTGETSQMLIVSTGGGIGYGVADLHAWDTEYANGPSDFVGNVGVIRRELNADTAVADWTLSSGSIGYTLLIDKNDATFIEADTVGLKSAFGAGDLPVGVSGILYQQVKFRAQKTDAADCDIAPSLISGADETDVVGQAATTLETWRWGIFGDDPLTDAPWLVAAANASNPAVTRTL